MQKNKGFTLAEVLITLGIIGVVAALTIPVFVSNYKKKQTVTQLKASYSIIAQAIKMSEADNGDKGYWNYSLDSKNFFNTYLEKYLIFQQKVNKEDKTVVYYWLNGSKISDGIKESIYSSTFLGYLLNGTAVYLHNSSSYSTTIMVDVNGNKAPNKVGIDLFHFVLDKKVGLVPWGYNTQNGANSSASSFGTEYNRNILKSENRLWACSKKSYGRWCTALIMNDGWEIAPDYPWTTR